MNGINGTPIPESGDALTPDQVWLPPPSAAVP